MKKIGKILVGVAMLAAVVGLAGCKGLNDDADKTITGTDEAKKVNAENKKDEIVRAYVDTKLKHYGGKFIIEMEKDSSGVMGLMFDLKEADSKRNFCIVGVSNTSKGLRPYVSKYVNVTDIQADNFGALVTDKDGKVVTDKDGNTTDYTVPATEILTTDKTAEHVIYPMTRFSDAEKAKFEDGDKYKFAIEFYPANADASEMLEVVGNSNTLKSPKEAENNDGHYVGKVSYVVKIYAKIFDGDPVITQVIKPEVTGYWSLGVTPDAPYVLPAQNKIAYYYNVQGKAKLKGSWTKEAFYGLTEVVE